MRFKINIGSDGNIRTLLILDVVSGYKISLYFN